MISDGTVCCARGRGRTSRYSTLVLRVLYTGRGPKNDGSTRFSLKEHISCADGRATCHHTPHSRSTRRGQTGDRNVDRFLQQEVRCRPPKWNSRVLAPTHTGDAHAHRRATPEHAEWPRRARRRCSARYPLGATPRSPTAPVGGPSTATTRTPSMSGVTGWVLAPRRVSPNVGTRISGRWPGALRRIHPL